MIAKQELVALMRDIYKGMQIPMFLLDKDGNIDTACEGFFPLPKDYFKDKLPNIDFHTYKVFSLFRKSDLFYIFPYEVDQLSMLCLGPFLYWKPSRSTSLTNIHFFSELGITALSPDQMEKVPYITIGMNQKLRILYQLIHQQYLSDEDIKKSFQMHPETSPYVSSQMENELFHQREDEESVLSYHLEKQLLAHVKKANSTAARSVYNEIVHGGSVHTLSKNQVKSAQFSFVAMITLLTRAVIEEGVSEVQAYTMSDVYIKKADEAFSIGQIHTMSNAAIIDFTRLVKTNKNKQDIKWVRICKEYIEEHLHEEIKLEDLARHVHMNASYLSVQFKKIVGQSMKEYINQEKIKEAQFLLRNTLMSIQDIAFSLHYGSENYFAKVFKQHTNVLPSSYRNEKSS